MASGGALRHDRGLPLPWPAAPPPLCAQGRFKVPLPVDDVVTGQVRCGAVGARGGSRGMGGCEPACLLACLPAWQPPPAPAGRPGAAARPLPSPSPQEFARTFKRLPAPWFVEKVLLSMARQVGVQGCEGERVGGRAGGRAGGPAGPRAPCAPVRICVCKSLSTASPALPRPWMDTGADLAFDARGPAQRAAHARAHPGLGAARQRQRAR